MTDIALIFMTLSNQLDIFSMNYIFITLLVFLGSLSCAFTQASIDRGYFEKELNKEKGSQYIRKAIDFGKQALEINDTDNALYFLGKSFEKAKSTGQKEASAIVAYEVASIADQSSTTNNSVSNFVLDMLGEITRLINDTKTLAKTNEIASKYLSNKDKKISKKASIVVSATSAANVEYQKQVKELEDYQQRAKVEETVITQKAELTNLSSAVDKLKGIQDLLSTKMNVSQELLKNMSRENLEKEAMLEKKQRLIDSISFEATIDSIIMDSNSIEIKQKESELKLKESQRNLFLSFSGFILLISGFLYYRFSLAKSYNKQLEEKRAIIEKEKNRSDELLLNILPEEVANELKISGKVAAQHYATTTILFADFVNFSYISRKLSPQELVSDLDYCFRHFDEITGNHGVEKIKTIGDAYMCVAGVPVAMENHAEAAVHVAMGFINFLKDWNKERDKKNLLPFNIRLGLHSGPVCAGVVGTKKFVFDIWGDAVNIASRMESSAEPGKINISESTYDLVKHKFKCEPRGAILTKNMGELKMYYIQNY